MMMETGLSETSLCFYRSACGHIPEDTVFTVVAGRAGMSQVSDARVWLLPLVLVFWNVKKEEWFDAEQSGGN